MVKILFCGDFVANNPESIKIDSNVQQIFDECEIKACNFEAPVKSNGIPIQKSGPSLRQSESSPYFLEKLGFNIIQTANNHMFDFGEAGFEATKKSFQSSLLIGAGIKDEAYQIKSIKIGEFEIGFMSLTHYEFGTLGLESAEKDFGCAWINHPIVNKRIIENRSKFDYLFILPHAGIEEINAPLPEWRQRYKEFIDLGADGVFASHPHVPQGWEIYEGKPIFYSLGNFFFETSWKVSNEYWNEGLMVELTLSGKSDVSYYVYNIQNKNGSIRINCSPKIKLHTNENCEILNNNDNYLRYLNTEVLKLWKAYNIFFIRGLGAVSLRIGLIEIMKAIYCIIFRKPNKQLFLNNLRCESHRWAIIRALELKNQ